MTVEAMEEELVVVTKALGMAYSAKVVKTTSGQTTREVHFQSVQELIARKQQLERDISRARSGGSFAIGVPR